MRIPLSRPYEGFRGAKVDAIDLREPTGSLLLVHGEPVELMRTRDGAPVVYENREAIAAYLRACCEPGEEILSQLTVEDFRTVKRALLDFFIGSAPASTAPLN